MRIAKEFLGVGMAGALLLSGCTAQEIDPQILSNQESTTQPTNEVRASQQAPGGEQTPSASAGVPSTLVVPTESPLPYPKSNVVPVDTPVRIKRTGLFCRISDIESTPRTLKYRSPTQPELDARTAQTARACDAFVQTAPKELLFQEGCYQNQNGKWVAFEGSVPLRSTSVEVNRGPNESPKQLGLICLSTANSPITAYDASVSTGIIPQ